MAKPTYVGFVASTWTLDTNPQSASASITTQDGDRLVCLICNSQDSASNPDIYTPDVFTWATPEDEHLDSYCGVRILTTTATAGTNTISVEFTGVGQDHWGFVVLQFRDSDGFGASNSTSGASGDPGVTLSSVLANSAICMVVGDWNAVAGTETATSVGDAFVPVSGHPGDGATYGAFTGYYPNIGTEGNKTVGMTVPDGQKWTVAALEVKGTSGGTPSAKPGMTVNRGISRGVNRGAVRYPTKR